MTGPSRCGSPRRPPTGSRSSRGRAPRRRGGPSSSSRPRRRPTRRRRRSASPPPSTARASAGRSRWTRPPPTTSASPRVTFSVDGTAHRDRHDRAVRGAVGHDARRERARIRSRPVRSTPPGIPACRPPSGSPSPTRTTPRAPARPATSPRRRRTEAGVADLVGGDRQRGGHGYEISRDGSVLNTTGALGYVDTSIAPGTHATYSVVAIDPSGNRSDPATAQATTPTRPDLVHVRRRRATTARTRLRSQPRRARRIARVVLPGARRPRLRRDDERCRLVRLHPPAPADERPGLPLRGRDRQPRGRHDGRRIRPEPCGVPARPPGRDRRARQPVRGRVHLRLPRRRAARAVHHGLAGAQGERHDLPLRARRTRITSGSRTRSIKRMRRASLGSSSACTTRA